MNVLYDKLASRFKPITALTPTTTPKAISGRVRLSNETEKLHIELNGAALHLNADASFTQGTRNASRRDWLIVPENSRKRGIAYFARLRPGDSLFFDGDASGGIKPMSDREASEFPLGVFLRNHEGDLFLEPLNPATSALVSSLDDGEYGSGKLERETALDALDRCKEIFGGKFELLEKVSALKALKHVNKQMKSETWQPLSEEGDVGAVLELPNDVQPIIVGDLHGNLDNLLKILTALGVLAALEKEESCLLILGDMLHPREGDLEDMSSSLLLLDVLLALKTKLPRSIFFLRGNHESFSSDVSKQGVLQGVLLEEQVLEKRGAAYRDELLRFFDLLPLIGKSTDFIACHAAPTRTRVTYDTLVNLRRFPGHIYEITRNRILKPGYPAGYTKSNVKQFRKALGVKKGAAFFVGHTPLSDDMGYWLNVQGVKNHHIVDSSGSDRFAVFTRIKGQFLPLEFRSEQLVPLANENRQKRAYVMWPRMSDPFVRRYVRRRFPSM